MPELVKTVKDLCNEHGFWQIVDALADVARLHAVDAAMAENDRMKQSWDGTVKALTTTSQLYRGGR